MRLHWAAWFVCTVILSWSVFGYLRARTIPVPGLNPTTLKADDLVKASYLVRGPKQPKFTIIEFVDYECPGSASKQTTMSTLMLAHGEKVQHRIIHLPAWDRPQSKYLAKLSLTAAQRGKLSEFHFAMLWNQTQPMPTRLDLADKIIGLTPTNRNEIMYGTKSDDAVLACSKFASDIGVNSTPKFLLIDASGGVFQGGLTGEAQALVAKS